MTEHKCKQCDKTIGVSEGDVLTIGPLKVRRIYLVECPFCHYPFDGGWHFNPHKRRARYTSRYTHGGS